MTFAPDPGAAPMRRMVAAQAGFETRTLLRNGEQLTLTLIIPLLLLAAFSLEPLVSFGGGYTRIDFLTPGVIALAHGWSPDADASAIVTVPLLVLLGTAAFSGFALLLAGTLRAEATLAAANLIYVVLLGIGGVVFPLTKFPSGARPLLELLPTGALSTGLRDVLANAAAFPVKNVLTLAVWAVLGIALAARFFRWE